jgi:DNA-binding HxlR family transcriptional regulator
LITRTKYDDIPPRVEYTLTEYGKELEQLLKDMMDWGEKHLDIKNKKYIDDDILVKEES